MDKKIGIMSMQRIINYGSFLQAYLLATLYNAPTTIDSYYAAQVRHDFGWGGRSN